MSYGVATIKSLYMWSKRRHPNKSVAWIVKKYFRKEATSEWRFYGQRKEDDEIIHLKLARLGHIPIQRHLKIKGEANPYDPSYRDYFKHRASRNKINTEKDRPSTATSRQHRKSG